MNANMSMTSTQCKYMSKYFNFIDIFQFACKNGKNRAPKLQVQKPSVFTVLYVITEKQKFLPKNNLNSNF